MNYKKKQKLKRVKFYKSSAENGMEVDLNSTLK